jgi:hypothetical protein
MRKVLHALIFIAVLLLAMPVVAQTDREPGRCRTLEVMQFQSWLDQFQVIYADREHDMFFNMGFIAVYIEEGAAFGETSCDWIRADYYQTAALFYSMYTGALATAIVNLTGATTADIGLLDSASLRFHDWLLEVSRPEVTTDFPFVRTP